MCKIFHTYWLFKNTKQKNTPITGTSLAVQQLIKSPPSKGGEGTRIPHATGQLGPQVTITELTRSGAHALQSEAPAHQGKIPHAAQRHHLLQLRPNALKNE